ncbi:MAG: FeoA family protein [Archaeoglobaceae archaeon]|nr:FeoA family protein [Archaeoglobales archaeon]
MKTLENSFGRVRIKEIIGGRGFVCRLADLGLAPGQVVEVLSNGPPVIIKVKDTKIAIGRGVARKVIVENAE